MLKVCWNPETGRQVLVVGGDRHRCFYITGRRGIVELLTRGIEEFSKMYHVQPDADLGAVISALSNPGDGYTVSAEASKHLRKAAQALDKGNTTMATDTKKPSKLAPAKSAAKPVLTLAKPAGKPVASAPAKPAKPLPVAEKPAAKTSAPVKAEKPAAKESTGRVAKVADSEKISYTQANPKRANSESYARYEMYKKAKTVGEAISMGASRQDVNYDIAHGFATVA